QQLNCDSSHLPLDLKRRENLEYVSHLVNIFEKTKLAAVLCSNQLKVNSHHHQAVKNVAEDLKIIARSDCGVIEALESKTKKFLLGVQWHPEDLIESVSCFNNLFAALVQAAADFKSHKD
ncbi:MAG: gamma-glutamyl-gamma-aminobutyrate hydrolase family protein, partial [Halanaerobium sp.]